MRVPKPKARPARNRFLDRRPDRCRVPATFNRLIRLEAAAARVVRADYYHGWDLGHVMRQVSGVPVNPRFRG